MSESTWDDPRITAYVLGEMSADEQAEFQSELESDAVLAAAVDEARGVTSQLKELYASETTPPLDSARRIAIVHGEATPVALPPAPSLSWRVPMIVLAAAAVLLLLVGLAPWLRQQETTVAQDNERLKPEQLVKETQRPTQLRVSESGDVKAIKSLAGGQLSEETMGLDEAASDPQLAAQNAVPRTSHGKVATQSEEKALPQRAQVARGRAALQQPPESADKSAEESGLPDQKLSDSRRIVSGGQVMDERAEGFGSQQQQFQQQVRGGRSGGAEAPKSSAMPRALSPAAAAANAPDAPMNASEPNDRRGDSNRKADGDADKLQKRQLPAAPMDLAGRPAPAALNKNLANGQAIKPLKQEMQKLGDPAAAAIPMPALVDREVEVSEVEDQMGIGAAGGGLGGGGFAGRGLGQLRSTRGGNAPTNEESLESGGELLELGFEADPEGQGPANSGDQFDPITDNPFKRVDETAFSTFSIDVDTASYSKTRDVLMRAHRLPSPDAVRIEEMINYFDYDYKAPAADAEHPFAMHVEVTTCPWNTKHKLARIALQGKTMTKGERPPCNLVFLLDVSGSMDQPNKLPLVVEGMQMLIDQLKKKDRVAIVVYAGSEGLVLDSISAKNKQEIKAALTRLRAGGSTNGGAGIALAYQTARDNFIAEGVNRVILCTDGDFNVGVTSTSDLVRMVEKESNGGIFISVLGFGMGNHNDSMLEQISGRGNGNYAYIDTQNEARKVLVDQTNGTLVTIAKDVKIQIEFNIKHVSQFRLIGYENRILAKEDFKNDKIDAGEIGAGHAVTALYELVPVGLQADAAPPKVDPPKYQTKPQPTEAADSDELMTLKLRYKQPDGDTSVEVETTVDNKSVAFDKASDDTRFATAVAGFGMKLRRSRYAGTWTLTEVEEVAKSASGEDDYELRAEFVELVRNASQLMGEE